MHASPAAQDRPDGDTTADRRLDRRALLVGLASAAGVAAVSDDPAGAFEDTTEEIPQIIGRVTRHESPRMMHATLDHGEEVRVLLASGARVEREGRPVELGDFEPGDWFLALGEPFSEGTFSATRVIPAALGVKKPPTA